MSMWNGFYERRRPGKGKPMHEIEQIEQLANKRQLGQGEVMRIAAEVVGHEVASLYDLDRAQLTRIVGYLDALELIGTA